ncbi:DUF3560 domain-containing protein [Actinomadura sp. KC216]|uniref:DUF3560 domain-containing protein n=1 Tax=Actinomadura sp. KC216 TaxID=2530370 RepID=UPI0010489CFF|nr:DUF3560 domain-containing protein [Actinomadura sp. KC216]TDB89146.1 DUF3560 domain-containing protein [Actinomadura sp. KC216]
MPIAIRHNREDGTLIDGSERGDGVYEVLRGLRCGWRWMPSIGRIGLRSSRFKAAKRYEIEQAAQALRAAGHDVEVDIDDATLPATGFAGQEAERSQRADQRTDRYADYADNAAARSEAAYARYRQSADNWPLGQPLISGSARAAHRRMMGAHDTSMAERDKARYWAGRQRAAQAHQHHREALPTVLRRIERLEQQRRRLVRLLEGEYRWIDDDGGPALMRRSGDIYRKVAPAPADAARWTADLIQLDGELGYWRDVVADKQRAGQKVWTKNDFSVGDFVKQHGTWFEVVRVNKKSVTVPWMIGGVTRGIYTVADARRQFPQDKKISTDTIPYDKVEGRASAKEIQEAMTRTQAKNRHSGSDH